MSTWAEYEAEKAFRRAARARRRARLIARLRRQCLECGLLAVAGGLPQSRRSTHQEIPVDEITSTVEPNRAAQFDQQFRPAPHTRARWQRIWMAMHHGTPLPPISVVRVCGGYAIRDGHHRVSVAKFNGVTTISAIVA
jgi:hypothetical protein